jgi:glycosyltransferase involved in cell wall biosynthesis
MKKTPLAIVTPVFNDWESFQQLIRDIDEHLVNVTSDAMILAVDDGSTTAFTSDQLPSQGFTVIKHIEILHLARNTGHQCAIAVGLAYLEKNFHVDQVIVMDADGEDSPSDLPSMITEQLKTGKIIFARRGQRKESFLFRFYYAIYRLLFYCLTGNKISFGNFCIIPGNLLRQVVFLPEIWGHFASGILRSKLPQNTILIDRKVRYHGKTKMNFTGLVMHGLSAFSVYTDILSIRLILFTLAVMFVTVMGVFVLIYIRYFTILAIPGWATTVGFGLMMILLQSFLLLLSLAFNVLNSRSTQTYIPAKYFEDFLLRIEVVYG